ncbi:MAG: alpha/beta hydrolase [Leptolyngbya sp. SIO4C1]|nr:alpha/beta hydrolase [Leptolyngbya sp. SIO4C1]
MKLTIQRRGQGSPLLCLHGHPGSSRSMAVFTERLSQQFETIAPDLRGYGASRPTTDFEMAAHLQDLSALMTDLPDCLILGWSLGGILAIELALRYPQQVQGLILVATAARPRSSHPPITWQDNFYTGLAGLVNWAIPAWSWNIEQWGKRSLFRYLMQQHTPHAYQRLAQEGVSAYLKTSAQAARALNQAIRQGYNRLPDCAHLPMPSLMLCGEQDRHITAAASRETAAAMPDCELRCYAHTAHLFPWEIPEQMHRDIELWLRKKQLL